MKSRGLGIKLRPVAYFFFKSFRTRRVKFAFDMSMSTSEAACVYAALILHDDGVEITAEKMSALIAAADVEIEPIWPTLFAKALAGKDIGSFLFNVGSSGIFYSLIVLAGPAPAAAGAAAPAAGGAAAEAPKAEKKKEEVKEESDDDMGFGLFD